MTDSSQHLAVALFSELLAVDQLARIALDRVLPKGMELSHFSVLNHLAHMQSERSPTQLAQTFPLTRGAMTNTLNKLEWAGYIHVRPDWDDARKKMVSISPAGIKARDAAVAAISPLVSDVAAKVGEDRVRAALPLLRELRLKLSE